MSEIIEPQEISVMSLNGDGTQENPYQITTVAEFRGMNDSTAYFKLMNDLDVNDSEWATNWAQADIAFYSFDGDGHEIRNVNNAGSTYTLSITGGNFITNINFANWVKDGGTSIINYTSTNATISQVKMSITVNNITSLFDVPTSSSVRLTVENTSISLTGTIGNLGHISNLAALQWTNVAIKLNGVIFLGNKSYNGYLINCGNNAASTINKLSITGSATINNQRDIALNCYTVLSSYIALDMIDSPYLPLSFTSGTPLTACFYDQELAGITMAAQTNLHALTTAQCKDKDYLNSIGFVVV